MTHENEQSLRPGLELQMHARELLSAKYGPIAFEKRVKGKKADLFFERRDYGRTERVYVEVKDINRPLRRDEVIHIATDYKYVINKPRSLLLLITRNGLAEGAESYIVEEQSLIRHQTIWDLEREIFGLDDYLHHLEKQFQDKDLNSYYVEATAIAFGYSGAGHSREMQGEPTNLLNTVDRWITGDDSRPIAVLGGYGAGKSSFAKRLVSDQARKALADPTARRPILIGLGEFTGHSRLEGVLGAMFTADFPVPHFNVHRFLDLNRRGRFLIVLDGFDEMKHAMTFSDFRLQLQELNKLIEGHSRVILLGRPSAFLSNEEHFYVLRGRRPAGLSGWQRLPEWPEFLEYDLQEFSGPDQAKFINGYLEYVARKAKPPHDSAWVRSRSAAVERIAASETTVFGKPVHVKILIDLASDPDVDISVIGGKGSRWQLYELFFKSLVDREGLRPARQPIGDEYRLVFLRAVAHWLWSEKAGATSFSAGDIPQALMANLPDGDAQDKESKKREYLSGAFLEKKSGEMHYFPHRSFVEYLVADWLVKNPAEIEYARRIELLSEGVKSFLLGSPHLSTVAEWARHIHFVTNFNGLGYFDFLRQAAGTPQSVARLIASQSPWQRVLGIFEGIVALGKASDKEALELFQSGPDASALLALKIYVYQNFSDAGESRRGEQSRRSYDLAMSILNRLFLTAMRRQVNNTFYFLSECQGTSELLRNAVARKRASAADAIIEINLDYAVHGLEERLDKLRTNVSFDHEVTRPGKVSVRVSDFLAQLNDWDVREMARIFWQRHEGFGAVQKAVPF